MYGIYSHPNILSIYLSDALLQCHIAGFLTEEERSHVIRLAAPLVRGGQGLSNNFGTVKHMRYCLDCMIEQWNFARLQRVTFHTD